MRYLILILLAVLLAGCQSRPRYDYPQSRSFKQFSKGYEAWCLGQRGGGGFICPECPHLYPGMTPERVRQAGR